MVELDEKAVEWEHFQDEAYFGMWCVREKGARRFGDGFHTVSKQEALALVQALSATRSEGAEATALAAKDAEITELKGRLAVRMDYLMGLATTADRHVTAAAEAALSTARSEGAREATERAAGLLAQAKDEIVRTADDLSMHSLAVALVESIAEFIGQPVLNSRALVHGAAIRAQGETE